MTKGIVPVFDPNTGSSGGPVAGAATSYSQIPWKMVDLTDGSWTLTDPDSLVDVVTHAADFNKVVMNALAVGSTNYAFGTSNDLRAPRWHKNLEASGVRVTTDDTFVAQFRMTKGSTVTEWNTEVVCAACVDPTNLASNLLDGVGGMIEYIASSNTGYGIWTVNAKSVSTGASNAKGITSTLTAGGRSQGGTYITLDSGDGQVAGGTRNAGNVNVAATDMFLMVGVGTRGSATITAGDDTNFKLEYRVLTFAA